MKRLSPSASRLLAAACLAIFLLLCVLATLPALNLPSQLPEKLAEVELQIRQPAQDELPFLAQDEPEKASPDNPDARTADAYNRRVERETMARRTRPARDRLKPEAKPAPAPSPAPPTEVTPDASSELALDLDFMRQPPKPSSVDLFDLPELTGGPRLPDLQVEEGERTWLNSRGVRYGGFFRRLQNSIARQWDPVSALRRRDPTGLLYGTQDRQTVLRLRLNANGYLLERPKIIRGSGLKLLDQEAIRAVVAAAPFANPPKSLLRNGVIDLHRFSFYFEIDRSRYYLRRD